MATCMFSEFKRERECFEETQEAFRRVFPNLDISGEKEFGGYGNSFSESLSLKTTGITSARPRGQDCLWGFGMRYAMASGYLGHKHHRVHGLSCLA